MARSGSGQRRHAAAPLPRHRYAADINAQPRRNDRIVQRHHPEDDRAPPDAHEVVVLAQCLVRAQCALLINLRENYLSVIRETFPSHHLFQEGLKNSFTEIVNIKVGQ